MSSTTSIDTTLSELIRKEVELAIDRRVRAEVEALIKRVIEEELARISISLARRVRFDQRKDELVISVEVNP